MSDHEVVLDNPRRKKINWAPYILIAPTVLYLLAFFAYPMFRGLILAVYDDEAILTLQAEATLDSEVSGELPRGTFITVLDRQGNLVPAEEIDQTNLQKEIWYQITAEDAEGQTVEGWVSETRVRIREEAEDGTPLNGTIRRIRI